MAFSDQDIRNAISTAKRQATRQENQAQAQAGAEDEPASVPDDGDDPPADDAQEAPGEPVAADDSPSDTDGKDDSATPAEGKEAAPEPEPEPEPTDRLSKSWAAIAKREARLREQQKEFAEHRRMMEQQAKEIEELRGLKGVLETLREDPIAVLDKLGPKDWYEKATKRFLADPSGRPSPQDEVAKIKAQLAKEREDREKWFEEKWQSRIQDYEQQRTGQQQAQQYTNELNNLVATDDRFELTRTTAGAIEAVLEVTSGYLKEYGKLLSPEEAATLVENELEEQAEKLHQTKKLQQRFAQQQQAQPTSPPRQQPSAGSRKQTQQTKTLSDNLAASGTPAVKMTREQEIMEAAKLYRTLIARGD